MTDDQIEATVAQRLMWFLDRYRRDGGALNCPFMCRVRGPLDLGSLERALYEVLNRHRSVCSSFARSGQSLVQNIGAVDAISIDVVSIDPSALDSAIADELSTPVDPTVSTIRVTLWELARDDHVLCVNLHHLVTDSWSCVVMFEDLCAALQGSLSEVSAGWTFAEFAAQESAALAGPAMKLEQRYWQRKLSDLQLPDIPMEEPNQTARETGRARGVLSGPVVAALSSIARMQQTTTFAVLLTLYYSTLGSVTGQADLTVASLFANRTRPEVKRTVGFLANMLLLRTAIEPTSEFRAALSATTETVTEALVHQWLPYQLLSVKSSDGKRRPDDVVFQLLADPVYSTSVDDLEIEVMVPDGVGSRFEFELVVIPEASAMQVLLFYNRNRVDEAFAQAFVDRYVAAASRVAIDQSVPIKEIQ